MKNLTLPLTKDEILQLRAGDVCALSGTIYSARDAAHKRMCEALQNGQPLPIDIQNQVIYYMGPSPARPGNVTGSAGPTTSGRMDKYAPTLLNLGLCGMIGKGKRNEEVKAAIIKNKAVYFVAIGGAGALLSHCIKKCEVVAYDDLGPEAIRKIEVENFPVIVEFDCFGNDLYEAAMQQWRAK